MKCRYVLPIIALLCSSCSVGMALHGQKDPNLGAIRVGTTRGEVELHLGKPIKTATIPEGRVDIYEYEIGDEPSAGRAVLHGIMDVLTIGIWEVIGTPVEAVQGKKHEITVTYDKDDRVVSINQPEGEQWTKEKTLESTSSASD